MYFLLANLVNLKSGCQAVAATQLAEWGNANPFPSLCLVQR